MPKYFSFVALMLVATALKVVLFTSELPFDADYVPVVRLGWEWLNGGAFPVHGTLSSVAGYNMPFLVWLHLPMLSMTGDVRLTIVLTLMLFHLIGVACIYALGKEIANPRVAWLASALFTLSDTGITSTYNAWAQLLLPSFFAMLTLSLWRWAKYARGEYLAGAGVIAVSAFMNHFSAIMLFPMMLIFALFTRARWQWRGLLVGTCIGIGLLAPYLVFQVERDFVDLRAFLTKTNPIPSAVLERYKTIAYPPVQAVPPPASTPPIGTLLPNIAPENPSRLARLGTEILRLAYSTTLLTLPAIVADSPFYALNVGVLWGTWGVILLAIGLNLNRLRHLAFQKWRTQAWAWLGVLLATYTIGMVLTRTFPSEQPSYFAGYSAWGVLMSAWAWDIVLRRFRLNGRALGIAMLLVGGIVAGVTLANRIERKPALETRLFPQVWYLSHLEAVADTLAQEIPLGTTPTISYDLLPEMSHQWWAMAWHERDSRYGLGMVYDFLLLVRGIRNANTSPIGLAETPDYIITIGNGVQRYDIARYDVRLFGKIALITPKRNNP